MANGSILGQLGCADYAVRIVTRGRLAVIWEEVPFTSLSYERVLDDTAQAQIIVDGIDPGCAAKASLAAVKTWRHELAIYRAGTIVFIGPIVGKSAQGTRVTIKARDRSAWWDREWIHTSHVFVATELSTIFSAYFADAMSVNPIAGYTLTTTPTGITGSRTTDAADHKPAGSEMREIAQVGIDWTHVGEVCLAGGKSIVTGRLPVIADEHLRSTPQVDEDGLAQTNRVGLIGAQPVDAVTGSTIAGPRIYGQADDAPRQAADGVLEQATQDDKILDAISAQAGAASTLALNGDAPIIVSSLDLAQNAPTPMETLIPGALLDVELTYPAIAVSEIARLAKVSVNVDPRGELVTLDLQPIGTT